VRNQYSRVRNDNQGAGGFNLPSKAYDASSSEDALQVTDTAILSPRALTETRFQFLRAASRSYSQSTAVAITCKARSRAEVRR